ncbi:MAG TPA: hypothetical protein ENK20_01115 [Chromatiales bacterium]|nr:hypothetical protein [Chromatiales bacterium]
MSGGRAAALRAWWRALAPRERRALAAGAGAALALAALAGGLELREARVRAVAELRAQEALAAWIEGAAEEARRLRSAGRARPAPAPGGPAEAMARAEAAARAAGVADRIRAMRPAGGRALEVRVEDAPYGRLLRWLARLPADGLEVRRLALARRAPGRVDGTVLLAYGPPG